MGENKDHAVRNIIISILLSGYLVFNYQQGKIHELQQEVKLAEKQQEVFVRAFRLPSNLYSAVWGLYSARQGNLPQEEITKRFDIVQSLFSEGNTIRGELLLNFKNQNIGENWENLMQKYQVAQYPVSQGISITPEELNKNLHEADIYQEKVISSMYLEIKQSKK